MAGVVVGGEKLLDFSVPLDLPLLDATVNSFYCATTAEEVRSQFPHPDRFHLEWRGDLKKVCTSATVSG
jgi:hypothetical protein